MDEKVAGQRRLEDSTFQIADLQRKIAVQTNY
jgi:hypothetical protein